MKPHAILFTLFHQEAHYHILCLIFDETLQILYNLIEQIVVTIKLIIFTMSYACNTILYMNERFKYLGMTV